MCWIRSEFDMNHPVPQGQKVHRPRQLKTVQRNEYLFLSLENTFVWGQLSVEFLQRNRQRGREGGRDRGIDWFDWLIDCGDWQVQNPSSDLAGSRQETQEKVEVVFSSLNFVGQAGNSRSIPKLQFWGRMPSPGNLSFCELRPSTDWIRPAHMNEDNLYLKSADCKYESIYKIPHSNV